MVRSIFALLAAVIAAACAQDARAEILSVTSGGSGGTTPLLSMVSFFNPDDGVLYNADFTSIAPIDITFKVAAGPSETYYLGLPGGATIANDTSSPFLGFDVKLETIITGTAISVGDPTLFPNVIISDATEAKFTGPPGLEPGGTMFFGLSFNVPTFGGDFEFVELVLTPSVPEVSTWAMMLVGFAGLGLLGYQTSRRGGAAHGGLARNAVASEAELSRAVH